MTVLREIAEVFSRWLDAVAAAIVAAFGWFISPRVVQIVEEQDGSTFTVRVPKDEGTQAERIQLGDARTTRIEFGGVLGHQHLAVAFEAAAIIDQLFNPLPNSHRADGKRDLGDMPCKLTNAATGLQSNCTGSGPG